jgi:hypothetical protein
MFMKLADALKKLYYAPFDVSNPRRHAPSGLKELDDVLRFSRVRSEINDHLPALFTESLVMNPKLIVELGVYYGRSTYVFERVARISGAKLIGVDVIDCSGANDSKDWIFVQKDDIEFAKEFRGFCRKRGIEPRIDVLYIDTSHEKEQTLREIASWFPLLSERSKVMFHDTNCRKIFFRKDRTLGFGYNNNRGVISALEEHFGKSLDERKEFIDFGRGWLIRHYPYCNGLTILERGTGKPFSQ